jgi:leader peptidase (prepilin peptidase)/N-methyltransferase
MTVFLAVCAAVVGYAASRSIVALSDTHRLDLDDRWYGPVCTTDGEDGLNLSMSRCRGAGHPQRRSNLAVVVGTVVLMVVMVFVVPSLWLWPAFATFTFTMVLLTVTDLDTLLIPNRMLGPLVGIGFALLALGWIADRDSGSLPRAVVAAVGYFTVMYLLAIVARGGLGFGDVKLAVLIGLFTGYLSWGATLAAGVGSFLIGGLVSLILLGFKLKGRKDAIPFGPFMVAAGLIATIWGGEITRWYVG